MSNNRQLYAGALDKWDALHTDESYSLPPELGSSTILLPFNHSVRPETQVPGESFEELRQVGLAMADTLNRQRPQSAEVAVNATVFDFETALADPQVSSIMVLGHGCLSSVEIASPTKQQRLDWLDISGQADHLKTGRFLQYMCGTLPRELNVPLGQFAMISHRAVWAAVGRRIITSDISLDGSPTPLQPVSTLARMTYTDIREHLPKRQLTISQEAHVALGHFKNILLSKLSAGVSAQKLGSELE